MRIKLFESFEIDNEKSKLNDLIISLTDRYEKPEIHKFCNGIFVDYDDENNCYYYNFYPSVSSGYNYSNRSVSDIQKELPFVTKEFESIIDRFRLLYPSKVCECYFVGFFDCGKKYFCTDETLYKDDDSFTKSVLDGISPKYKSISFSIKFYI